MAPSPWLGKRGAAIVVTPGPAARDNGKGLNLNCADIKGCFADAVEMRRGATVPWATRVGPEVSAGDASPRWRQVVAVPKAPPA
eukprot:630899-Pyramimonas_sp.AAC.1